jgi:MFS superfamily sulfate permease-like transporter
MKIKWKPIILFIITMIITLGLEKLITPDNFLKSPMYLLLPIVGFFAMYYLTKPIMNYMKIKKTYEELKEISAWVRSANFR